LKVTYTEEAVADIVEAITYLNERNAVRRSTADNGNGNADATEDTEIQTIAEVADDLTSQSRHSLLLQGSPPSGKLLIPLERRDVRVVEGARLESDFGEAHRVIRKDLAAQSGQPLKAEKCSSM
jgi:hypothetical protein